VLKRFAQESIGSTHPFGKGQVGIGLEQEVETIGQAAVGEGFYYVLEGKLTVTLGKDTFTLGPGDSAHFDQRHPFQMSNAGKRVLRILWVGTPAIF
jgi:quercetin dioxygenase-like cupin family protein